MQCSAHSYSVCATTVCIIVTLPTASQCIVCCSGCQRGAEWCCCVLDWRVQLDLSTTTTLRGNYFVYHSYFNHTTFVHIVRVLLEYMYSVCIYRYILMVCVLTSLTLLFVHAADFDWKDALDLECRLTEDEVIMRLASIGHVTTPCVVM